jgi:neutral ceramidase
MNRREFLLSTVATAVVLGPRAVAAQASRFRAGVAAVDITPEQGIFIHGVLMRGEKSTGAHGRLFARSLALDDGKTRLVLTICDVRMIGRRICDEAKKLVTQRTGIPPANLLVAATHTHAAPTPVDLFNDEPYLKWQQQVIDGVAASMTQAVSDLAPARIGRASVRKPDYVFNRRWKLKDPSKMPADPYGETTDGVLTNPGKRGGELLEPAGPVDDELTVLSIQHADGRPLGLLANYSTHYVGNYAEQLVSSDY